MNRVVVSSLMVSLFCLHGEIGLGSTPTGVPYTNSFETYTGGVFVATGPWGTNGDGSAFIVSNLSGAAYGTNYLSTSNTLTLTLDVDPSANCRTGYVRFFTKPTFYDDNNGASPPSATSLVSAAFYFTTNGTPKAYTWNGATNVWTNFNNVALCVPTNNSAWLEIMVSLKYAQSNYDIWVATNGTALSLWATNVTMASGATDKLSQVVFQNGLNLDQVFLRPPPWLTVVSPYGYQTAVPSGTTVPHEYNALVAASISANAMTQYSCVGWILDGNADGSGQTNGTTISLTLNLTNDATLTWLWYSNLSTVVLNNSNMTSVWGVLAGDYTPSERTLAGRQGRDLASGFLDGERIFIFYTNGWNEYLLEGGQWQSVGTALSPLALTLGGGLGVVTVRSNTLNRVFGYNYSATGASLHTNLVGVTVQSGWNFLAWPFKTQGGTNYWGFGGGAAQTGSRLFLLDGTSGTIWWDGSKWMKGAVPLTYTLLPGQVFWFRNSGPAIQWQPVNPP